MPRACAALAELYTAQGAQTSCAQHRDNRIHVEVPGTALLQSPGIGKSDRSQLPLLRTLLESLTSRALPSALKIPLCDTSEANGSIEVLPCTQFLADPGLADSCKIVLLSRFAVRLANPKGITI